MQWQVAGLVTGLLIGVQVTTCKAHAADEATCATYAVDVERLVKQLTNDDDVAQAARYRAEAYCIVIDEPDSLVMDPNEGTAPATGKDDTWAKRCKLRFKSFRISDGTVIPAGKKKRVPCPIPLN